MKTAGCSRLMSRPNQPPAMSWAARTNWLIPPPIPTPKWNH